MLLLPLLTYSQTIYCGKTYVHNEIAMYNNSMFQLFDSPENKCLKMFYSNEDLHNTNLKNATGWVIDKAAGGRFVKADSIYLGQTYQATVDCVDFMVIVLAKDMCYLFVYTKSEFVKFLNKQDCDNKECYNFHFEKSQYQEIKNLLEKASQVIGQ